MNFWTMQRRIQDFRKWGSNPKGGQNYYLVKFSENSMKIKKRRDGGVRPKFVHIDPPQIWTIRE